MYDFLSLVLALKYRDDRGLWDRFLSWFSGLFILYLLLLLLSFTIAGGVVGIMVALNIPIPLQLLFLASNIIPIVVTPIIVMRLG